MTTLDWDHIEGLRLRMRKLEGRQDRERIMQATESQVTQICDLAQGLGLVAEDAIRGALEADRATDVCNAVGLELTADEARVVIGWLEGRAAAKKMLRESGLGD